LFYFHYIHKSKLNVTIALTYKQR